MKDYTFNKKNKHFLNEPVFILHFGKSQSCKQSLVRKL